MYTILVKSDDTLIATNKETIMHRSSLVRKLRFLVDPTIQVGNQMLNMADFVCVLEYKLPISNRYTPAVLTPSEELYKDKLEYVLDVDTKITAEVGNVEMQLLWTRPDMLASGDFSECVRVTGSTTITVLPVNQWSDYVASSDLSNIAQMVLSNQAQAEQLKMLGDYLMMTKADSIKYDKETNELTLMGDGEKLDSVTLEECDLEDGIPVVEFSAKPEEDDSVNNVVEF